MPETSRFGALAARSTVMSEVFVQLTRLSATQVPIVLVGESGTGKGVLARETHRSSPRSAHPFVGVDCRVVRADVVERELFGHEPTAGLSEEQAGAFERADGGTLFLRDAGELPLELQPRLLRALESRCVRRVGGRTERPFNARVVVSSARDLDRLVAAGQLREDLYFELSGAVVAVPPLRSRLDDLPLLVNGILLSLGRPDVAATHDALELLAQRTWPGNVRELKNAVARALAFIDGNALDRQHLELGPPDDDIAELERLPLGGQSLERLERVAIKQTLAQMRGVKSQTAQALGIAVSTLYEKLKKYGI